VRSEVTEAELRIADLELRIGDIDLTMVGLCYGMAYPPPQYYRLSKDRARLTEELRCLKQSLPQRRSE